MQASARACAKDATRQPMLCCLQPQLLALLAMSTHTEAMPEQQPEHAHLHRVLVEAGHALGKERVAEAAKGWAHAASLPKVKLAQGNDTVTLAWIFSNLQWEMGMPQTQWAGVQGGCTWKVALWSQVVQSVKSSGEHQRKLALRGCALEQ